MILQMLLLNRDGGTEEDGFHGTHDIFPEYGFCL